MKQYLAIDIGGTAVKLGIVDETGAVGPKAEESVNFDGYQTPVLTTVLKAAKAFVETQNIDVNTLEGVGVSDHRPDRQPQRHRSRYLRQLSQLHQQPHPGRTGTALRPARHRCQRCQLHDAGRGLGRRRKGLYRCHRRDPGHWRGAAAS